MNCLSWNCRGLGNHRRVRELSDLVKAKGPRVIFLMETRKKKSYLERLRCRLKFDNMFIVPRRNLGGGLALLWNNDLNLHIRTFSPRHIDAVVNPGIDDAWRFTGFYGAPEAANREDSWSVLRHLGSQFVLPWVCIGDFNEITRVDEKSGGAIRPKKQMQDFRDCLDVCGLKDLGFSGLPFTWCNRRYNEALVWVRLDRAVATADWILKFPTARLHHLPGSSSDHKPLWLVSDDLQTRFARAKKPFRFEAMWLNDERCEGVVHSVWDRNIGGDPVSKIMSKVEECQTQLKLWDKNVFGNVRKALARNRKLLVIAEGDSMAGKNHARVKLLSEEISRLMDCEERMWSQRSKTEWLRYGDQNTKYFHCRATERNKKNFISGLENAHGEWIEGEE